MPIDVEADLVERTVLIMPNLAVIDLEAETAERDIVQMPVLIVSDVEFP